MKKRDFLKTLPLWITPVVTSITLPAHAQTSPVIDPRNGDDPPCDDCVIDPQCIDCDPDGPCPDEWTKSSFTWDGNMLCSHGDGPSLCPIRYEVIRYVTINQGGGPAPRILESGFIPPLGRGCYDFSALIRRTGSAYNRTCIRVYQDDGHPGVGYTQNCY